MRITFESSRAATDKAAKRRITFPRRLGRLVIRHYAQLLLLVLIRYYLRLALPGVPHSFLQDTGIAELHYVRIVVRAEIQGNYLCILSPQSSYG